MKCIELPIEKKRRKNNNIVDYYVKCPRTGEKVLETRCMKCIFLRIALADKIKCEYHEQNQE